MNIDELVDSLKKKYGFELKVEEFLPKDTILFESDTQIIWMDLKGKEMRIVKKSEFFKTLAQDPEFKLGD